MNGNILSYIRNGNSPVGMDSLTYNYYSSSNKLKYVDDVVSAGNYSVDIDDQADSNYVYDKIGNLIADSSEGLTMNWFVNGKLKQVVNNNTDTVVTFAYDPMGNRISKKVETNTDTITTYYVRDAQGNILSTYTLEKDTIHWGETILYGSSRLGLHMPDTVVYPYTSNDTNYIQYPNYGGKKDYELTNHLGNVLSVVSDRKIGIDPNNNTIVDYWKAALVSQQDYYPFGMVQPDRNYSASNYRFGFNGMEKDDAVKGSANSYTTYFRSYDPRLARWISIDPEFKAFPWQSPYAAFDNNPITKVDPRGDAAGDPPYAIQGGVMSGNGVTNSISTTTERPKMQKIDAIVVHRTVSSSASSAIQTSMNNKGATGFHIIVDKDGSITQINNLENKANHVGKPKGNVSNDNSIGIEVVGMPVDKDGKPTTVTKDIVGWEPLTSEQIENTSQAVSTIMQEYDLGFDDIFPHEDVSAITKGEGQTVMDAIKGCVGELMQDYMQKKTESQDKDTHKDSIQKQKGITD